jgi:fucose permease
MLLGYVIGLLTIPKYLSQANALKFSAISGLIFTIAAVFTHGYTSVIFVALLGLSNALMWPAIWPLAISGLGRFTEKGSALLIMGIAGGAIIPKVFAEVKTDTNFQYIFFALMFPCYLYILYYGSKGYLVGKKSKV